MIKRYLLVILSISLFLSSCVQSPDDMLKQFNDNLYEDLGNGMYQHGDVIINPELIERDVYPVLEGDNFELRISSAYLSYDWTLTDNRTNEKYDILGFYIVKIGPQDLWLSSDRDYTLTVRVRNMNNVLFEDSAILKIKK